MTEVYLNKRVIPTCWKSSAKLSCKDKRKELKEGTLQDTGELCANCYLAETTLDRRLLKCSRCLQVKYCSKACQVEHHSTHKKDCRQILPAKKKDGGEKKKDGNGVKEITA